MFRSKICGWHHIFIDAANLKLTHTADCVMSQNKDRVR
jgi:hypothetical protein